MYAKKRAGGGGSTNGWGKKDFHVQKPTEQNIEYAFGKLLFNVIAAANFEPYKEDHEVLKEIGLKFMLIQETYQKLMMSGLQKFLMNL